MNSTSNYFYNILVKIFLPIIIVSFGVNTTLAQIENNLIFDRISIEQGLSQVTVYCIFQDSQGFMWIGTQHGLNKFDGYEFTHYFHNLKDTTSISNNYILSITEDFNGNLWIGTHDGLNRFNPKTNEFTRFREEPDNLKSLSNNVVKSVLTDNKGNIWVGTENGLNIIENKDIELPSPNFIRYQSKTDNSNCLSHSFINLIYENSKGVIWIGTNGGGLNKTVLNNNNITALNFTQYKNQTDKPESLSNNVIASVYEDKSGVLWVGTKTGGLNKFNNKKENFFIYKNVKNDDNSLTDNNVNAIYEDDDENLWIGTENGLNIFDKKSETFTHYRNNISNQHSLSNNFIRIIYKEAGGILWIGTDGGGLNKFDPNTKKIRLFKNSENKRGEISNNVVMSIFEDSKGQKWVGTDGGLNKIIPGDKNGAPLTFINYKNNPENSQSISHNSVFSIIEDSQGFIWVGTFGGGLNKLITSNKTKSQARFVRFTNQKNNSNSLSHNHIMHIYEDSDNILWIATFGGGLDKFDPKTGKFKHYKYQADEPYSISSDYVSYIYKDSKGNFWISTYNGLNIFDEKKEKFIRYQNNPKDCKTISNNIVSSVFEDSEETLWICTQDGLNKIVKENKYSALTFQTYKKEDGLPDNVIYGILEDENKNLWLSTNYGISKFNLESQTFTNYDDKDGLQSTEFNSGAFFKDKEGKMYFGGVNGFNEFFPDEIQDNTYKPKVVLTDFLLFNKSVKVAKNETSTEKFTLKEHINFTKEITLKYTDYIFTIEFTALNYRQSEKNRFKYKLEGLNEKWIETDYKNRRATYTNLDPGEYTFRVIASNDDGYWNEEGASIKILIKPPWWKTNTLHFPIIFLIILIIVVFIRVRERKLRKEKEKLEKTVKERTAEIQSKNEELIERSEQLQKLNTSKDKFFSIIAHDLKSPFNSIIGFSDMLIKNINKNDTEKIRRIADIIKITGNQTYNLLENLLEWSRSETGIMIFKPVKIQIIDVVNKVLRLMISPAKQKNIKINQNIKDDIYVYADLNMVTVIFRNLISNALKFTAKAGTVEIGSGEIKDSFITFFVCDSGVGMNEETISHLFDIGKDVTTKGTCGETGTGLGLILCKEFINKNEGDIWVKSEINKGSAFYFSLPIYKKK